MDSPAVPSAPAVAFQASWGLGTPKEPQLPDPQLFPLASWGEGALHIFTRKPKRTGTPARELQDSTVGPALGQRSLPGHEGGDPED